MKRVLAWAGIGLFVLGFVGALVCIDMAINKATFGDPMCAFVKCVRVVP